MSSRHDGYLRTSTRQVLYGKYTTIHQLPSIVLCSGNTNVSDSVIFWNCSYFAFTTASSWWSDVTCATCMYRVTCFFSFWWYPSWSSIIEGNSVHNTFSLSSFSVLFYYRAMHFSAFARSWDHMSSVCPSVTLVICDHIGWKSWKLIAQTISAEPSLFVAKRRST